ncbi:tonB-system energizer ExbB [Novosphingobium marinum]|uniref:Biopolymer transport protein ExbB n=1 Tax=Novosphingobium marinum TaxID=1514948 RepID=A0A7Y9XYQ0_9SPHN|nr:tonB-system energizer ExbB [Novosphingobium marinum]NYH97062.1 biopolymer transport protein ExbB [Novosphingobium marinum]
MTLAIDSHLLMGETLRSLILSAIPAASAVTSLGSPARAGTTTAISQIPTNLSVTGMFAQADWVVKLVMIGLIIASVVTWTVFFAKQLELRAARRKAVALLGTLTAARSLSDFQETADDSGLFKLAREEIAQSADAIDDREGLKERIVSRFDRHEALVARKMTQGVTILATIGATAPFVGLFGTVWGIMNAFIGIAEKQTTNLAVVAPGIAEALLATALGLIAAIPAVVIYNHFARQIAAHRAVVSDSAAALLRLVSRDLSRGTLQAGKA